ncbi:MAG: peptidoglycan DD-metalloendopeptidase family protein [candidate division SR1 bacterium]|nr:peptidoglycan DD-metalloendopeptidase family protein [candidate division SR1 bacterium]
MRSPGGTIVSARNGTIVAINFDGKWNQWCNSNTDCYNKGGVWHGNHILINHSDGSTSYYLHMRGGSLPLDLWVGKYIDQGTPLGIEGYTGYTCLDLVTQCSTPDPHIHF